MAHHHVLIADDEPDIRTILRRLLRSEGYRISEASDGREALDTARNCDVSLIVIDAMMPELSGTEAVRQLRADPRFATLPVLIITGHAGLQPQQWLDCRQNTVLLTKPLNLNQVVSIVHQMVHQT